MKTVWWIAGLIPVPFLFHFYEYGQQKARNEESPFLGAGFLVIIILMAWLSKNIKIQNIAVIGMVNGVVSLLLASVFIPDDGAWFTPVGRDGAIIFISIVYIVGQLLVRVIMTVMKARTNR